MNDKDVFTASNGVEVTGMDTGCRLNVPWTFETDSRGLDLGPDSFQALTEYVFHKHGLWLAPNGRVCVVQANPDEVGVIMENGALWYVPRVPFADGDTGNFGPAWPSSRAFFDAHPTTPPQCDAALEVEGVLIRCNKTWEHDLHEGSGKTSQGQSFTIVWETPR